MPLLRPFLLRCAAFLLVAGRLAGGPLPLGKLIATGWDDPSPGAFREHVAEFEKLPFDGAVIVPVRQVAGGVGRPASAVFSAEPWLPAECEPMTADLKAAAPKRAKDNFLRVSANPGDLDWFDDTAWREVVDHWRLLARSAKQGGLRGLVFDTAPRTAPHELFNYARQAQRAKHDFAGYTVEVRERGRAVMQAIAGEFPEAVVLCERAVADLLPLLTSGADPAELLATHTYGLLPAFLDGWLDVLPAKALLLEGNDGAGAFDRAYARLKAQAPSLFAPENRAKARGQLLVGHGVSLDAQVAPERADARGTSAAAGVRVDVAAALRASDGWVWIHGREGRWWPPVQGEQPCPAWTDLIPGLVDALARARRPLAAARESLAAVKPGENRLVNGNFSQTGNESLPAGWWTWQGENSRGTATRETVNDGVAAWSGAENAAYGQTVAVKPGERWLVGARVKKTGQGAASVTVRWKNARHEWTAGEQDVALPPDGAPDAEGWRRIGAAVMVPEGVSELVVLLAVRGQVLKEDRVCFDDAVATPEPK